MEKVLITGGAGFIGSSLANGLIKQNYAVRVLDNLSPQIHGNPEESFLYLSVKDKVDFIKGDVRNTADWEKALDGVNIVVHLAAETGTGQSMYEINRYAEVNVSGTARMLDHLVNHKHDVRKVVVASSRAIYGEGKYFCSEHGAVYPEGRAKEDMLKGDFECKCPVCGLHATLKPTDEDSKIHPASVYGITKYDQEALVLAVGRSVGLPAVALRYQNVYGPGQSLKNPYTGILSIFSQLIKSGKQINIFEDGKESRDFVFIDDVVQATMLAIAKNEANFCSFNVGSGKAVDVNEIVTLLKKYYDRDAETVITGDFRMGDIRHNFAGLEQITKKLGFIPSVFVDEGLRRFTQWVNTQQMDGSDATYRKSLDEMSGKNLFIRSS